MSRRVCVYGLWHLGCVTAACLAHQGHQVVGLDPNPETIRNLSHRDPPIAEPGLAELISEGLRNGRLRFTSDPTEALKQADTLWVAFDTPVDDEDHADAAWVRQHLDRVRSSVPPNTLIIVSSQVPVGFTSGLQANWS